jgi:hypothetical protein
MQLWREIAAQGYAGSSRMVSRFVETLKTTPVGTTPGPVTLPHYASHTAVWLFVRNPATLDAAEQKDLATFRRASPTLATTYLLVQDFFQMLHQREGARLDAWLAQVYATPLPELHSFAQGVEQDKEAVRAGLTLPINNDHVAYCTSSLRSRSFRFSSPVGVGLRRKEAPSLIIVAHPYNAPLLIPPPDGLGGDAAGGCQFFCRQQALRA